MASVSNIAIQAVHYFDCLSFSAAGLNHITTMYTSDVHKKAFLHHCKMHQVIGKATSPLWSNSSRIAMVTVRVSAMAASHRSCLAITYHKCRKNKSKIQRAQRNQLQQLQLSLLLFADEAWTNPGETSTAIG
ncbi:uncharacterized protein LOC111248115 [Varroa destructor]|uniref:Uncharacterized protein n=1 Tax=Varroa destructor TaxID=109461 RepID=A0A7M7JR78_VARDE|nr:uncharacterized protein LOC111248115 [Varroa destructor]